MARRIQRGRRQGLDAAEVVPGLWIGSLPDMAHCGDFDVVIVLCEERPPCTGRPSQWPTVQHTSITDGVLTLQEQVVVSGTVLRVMDEMIAGRKVLVTCWAGFNRAALVAGMVLVTMGYSGDGAIARIREVRGQYALTNESFRTWLITRAERIGGQVS